MSESLTLPTMTKLVSGLCLAAFGWVASEHIRTLMPPDTDFGIFNEVNVFLGFVCGWVYTGPRIRKTYADAIGAGLTGMGALILWALFLQSFNLMLAKSLERRYDGPAEAIVGIFENGVDYGGYLGDAKFIAMAVATGVGTGLIALWVSRRWR